MATTAHSGVPAKAPSRKDLSGPALRTFFRIADAWDLKEAEQMKLLGLDSRSTFQTWKRGAVAASVAASAPADAPTKPHAPRS